MNSFKEKNEYYCREMAVAQDMLSLCKNVKQIKLFQNPTSDNRHNEDLVTFKFYDPDFIYLTSHSTS